MEERPVEVDDDGARHLGQSWEPEGGLVQSRNLSTSVSLTGPERTTGDMARSPVGPLVRLPRATAHC